MNTLPPPLMTSDLGSFARSTIVERKPQIIAQALADYAYPPDIVRVLHIFRDEIAARPMQPLSEDAPDAAEWNAELGRYAGKTWLEVPWYFAEVYFYRRLLEAVRYFQPGEWRGIDPFAKQKRKQEAGAFVSLAQSWDQLEALDAGTLFEALLHSCLWGNRADLSNFTVQVRAQAGLATRAEREHLLIDHTDRAHRLLAAGVSRVDFINDNVGLDFLFDLALADFLLAHGWTQRVIMHLKAQPFFVSDVMPADAELAIARLSEMAGTAGEMGRRLAARVSDGRLRLSTHPFWTGYGMFRDFPPELRADLAHSALVIIKGDVNYRRLLDDRHWPHHTPLDAIASYFPAPFLLLRTLKGEIMVGLEPGEAESLAALDPTWLINGKRGVIQGNW